jgi:hypothetical protein
MEKMLAAMAANINRDPDSYDETLSTAPVGGEVWRRSGERAGSAAPAGEACCKD